MAADLQTSLRAPGAYDLARSALDEMQRRGVWPTPLNFELWLDIAADPVGALGAEVTRIVRKGEPLTEALSEDLAARHLMRGKFDAQVIEAGDQIDRSLRNVQRAIDAAQKSSADYKRTLDGATRDLHPDAEPLDVKRLVQDLAAATRQVQRQNEMLEQRLTSSTAEVRRLRAGLESAQQEAMTDALSRLPNRKAFDLALKRALADHDADGGEVALGMLDIDHFKIFNDTWGHQTGDQVIRYVASVLQRAAQPPYMAARFGGEEFVFILPGDTAATACSVLEGVRQEIGSRMLKRRSTEEDLGAVTVSIGIAQRRPGETVAALIERTDAALYTSKREGRDRVTNAEQAIAVAA